MTKGNLFEVGRISRNSVKPLILLLLCLTAAPAQIYPPTGGGYPGGTGYPGQSPYPGTRTPQTGPQIPIPGRNRTQKPSNTGSANQPMPNFRGTLRQMDEKTISLELGDNRVMDFRRNDKTKFLKAGEEVRNPKFNPGDQISVEAMETKDGYMTAMNVYWEKAAAGTTTSRRDDTVVDTWKDAPGKDAPATTSSRRAADDDPDRPVLRRADSAGTAERQERSADDSAPPMRRRTETANDAPPPARRDAEDPGPPVLRRGGVADAGRQKSRDYPEEAAGTTVARQAPREEVARDERPRVARAADDDDAAPMSMPRRSTDSLINKAADAALEFTSGLPSYVTTEAITRYQSESKPANFHALDVVTAEVVYENGKEDYRNLTINGKKTTKSMEDSGGAWSTGEFGTVLIDIFSPMTAADFHFRRDARVGSIMTKLYEFEVKRENSHWNIKMGSQTYSPAYSGAVWIDPQTARVLRIEMEAKGMPSTFPIDHVESATDYSYVRLGDAVQYLLPVHAENISCQRGTLYCSKNVIDFRNYHKYTGESSITFGGETKDKK